MAKITPQEIIDLKKRVKEECLRRSHNGSVASYGDNQYDYNIQPTTQKKISAEHRDKIAIPLNAIHSDKVPDINSQKNKALRKDVVALEGFTTILEKREVTDSEGTDCKSGCTGMCYSCSGTCSAGCSGTCTGTCQGCTSCSGCSGTCEGTCSGNCRGGCGDSCHTNCYDVCDWDCGDVCTGCSGGCVGTCSGCNGNCYGGAN